MLLFRMNELDPTGPSRKKKKRERESNSMTMQIITAHFIKFPRNSTSIDFPSLILTCCASLTLVAFPFFPVLCSFLSLSPQSFLLGAAVINSCCILWGTYYVQRTKSTFPASHLPVGLRAIDLEGGCQYEKEMCHYCQKKIKIKTKHVHT